MRLGNDNNHRAESHQQRNGEEGLPEAPAALPVIFPTPIEIACCGSHDLVQPNDGHQPHRATGFRNETESSSRCWLNGLVGRRGSNNLGNGSPSTYNENVHVLHGSTDLNQCCELCRGVASLEVAN
jgi:hypothetical protein